ncbi:MAG: alanine--glyoxylate aminotransferase family protein [Campylobacterales bacterium]
MILLTPGPTTVPEHIRQAMARPTIHHRTPEFEAIFSRARDYLKQVMGVDEVVMLASSGTGAMEACVLNLTHRRPLTINGGKFGERFTKIAKAYSLDPVEIVVEWGESVSVERVRETLLAHPEIDALFVQISESSTGARHPVEELAKAAKEINPDIMVVADGITAVGVEPIDVTHIDALITGSQKAFMLPPGLAMIGLSEAALRKIEAKPAGFYFNLATELKNQRKNTTAWTAATTLIIGLEAVLREMIEKTPESVYAKTAKLGQATRAALRGIGLQEYPKHPAPSLSTFCLEGADTMRKILKNEFGVNIAGGQDHLKNKIFRINHMGHVEIYEAAWAVNAIEMVLEKMGVRSFDGTANRLFMQSFCGA